MSEMPAKQDDSLFSPRSEWEWFGSAGHLIVASECRFHLTTLIGPWLVSTVGEWLPDSGSWHIYAASHGVTLDGRGDERRADFLNKIGFIEIGAGRKYETMVFRTTGERCKLPDCNCEMPVVAEWSELDSDGYNERGDAQRGHYAMCEKVAALGPGEEPSWDSGDRTKLLHRVWLAIRMTLAYQGSLPRHKVWRLYWRMAADM